MSARISISYSSSSHLWLLVVLALFHLCLSDQKSGDVLCMDGERQALVRFKQGLVDEAGRLASWADEKSDCCKWAGIVCDNVTGHVHEIHLRGLDGQCKMILVSERKEALKQMLGGDLNPSLMELKQLKYLDLSCNNFKEIQIPSFIGSLRNLRYLNLSYSNFSGMIPPQIGNISELRVLSLGGLYHETSMMKIQWLSSLRSLHHLDMSDIDLSKAIDLFQVINNLPSLVELHLSHCELSDIHPHVRSLNVTSLSVLDLSANFFLNTYIQKWIFSLTSLVSLDLSYCFFDHPLPSSIYSFRNLTSLESLYAHRNNFMNSSLVLEGLPSNLKYLDISYCDISSSALHSLHNLTSLLRLDLSENQLTKAILPISLPNLCNLRDIGLSGNNFGGIGLAYLLESLFDCKSPSLESLSVSSSGLSGTIPNSIGRLSSLKMLDLSENTLNGSIPDSIGQLSSLETLSLYFNTLNGSIPDSIGRLSSLKMLDLSGNTLNGSIPDSIGQLSSLEALSLSFNTLNGSIPDSIGRLSSLKMLYLSGNQLTGNLPASLGQLSKLSVLGFSFNLLSGLVTEAHFAKLVSLKYLDASNNNLTLNLQLANWTPPFHMQQLHLNSWGLGPEFPLWLQSQRDLTSLDISNTCISSPMPPESFWRSFPNLTYLDMSQNNITGTFNFSFPETLDVLDLSSNMFTGNLPSISNGSLMLGYLDLSNNSFVGPLHNFLCFNGMGETQLLSLGYNNLSGIIPECWEKWSSLIVLNLENNKLSGEIPMTLGSLLNLEWLNMHGNKISGTLPSSLVNMSRLVILQLGRNELVGNIPPWIGQLTFLRILNLRLNKLDGNIPDEFCYLTKTQILDLASNNLSGNIPRCFNNFSVLLGVNTDSTNEFSILLSPPSITPTDTLVMKGQFIASDTLVTKGQEYTYKSILGLVRLIDLSNNSFSGHIPSELTTLRELKSLNLSRNQLTGNIPEKIGDMKALESFDLSVNKLSGELPMSLSGLNFLSSFNVSYNKLTGRIPLSTQLQSLNESSFFGNKLCGAPLSDHCVPLEVPTDIIRDQKEDDGSEWGLVISIVLGFVIGFWIIVAPLILSASWRIAYYSFMRKLINV